MHYFDLLDGVLHAEGVSLEALAETVGTPTYVYSSATLRRHYGLLRDACDAHKGALGDALIAFAVKANSNLSVLATLTQLGCGADTVSEGEIRRALAAGIPGERIIFSGVGKTDAELAFAIQVGVRQINVESSAELERLIVVAAEKSASPAIAIRVNPKIGAGGHAKITTGGAGDKFGVPVEEALALYARASTSPHVTPVGLACHIGSQITDLTPLENAFRVLREMTETLRADGYSVTRLDLGGGVCQSHFEIAGNDFDDLRARGGSSKQFGFTVNAVDAHALSAGSRPNHLPIIGVVMVPSTHFCSSPLPSKGTPYSSSRWPTNR